jgi:hypothetical protein
VNAVTAHVCPQCGAPLDAPVRAIPAQPRDLLAGLVERTRRLREGNDAMAARLEALAGRST